MAINQSLWTKDFAANLYDSEEFYRVGLNWSSFVNGGIVHIPQAGADILPVDVTGATSLPISTTAVAYDDLTFTNKMIAAAPRYVKNIDASEASFDTRSEEMKSMISYLRQAISINIMNGWSTVESGSVVRTTGTATRENIYGQATVKNLTFNDILIARAKIVRQNASLNDLYLIVDPIMYSDLILMGQFENADSLAVQTTVEGFVGMIAGMKVIQRSLGNPFIDDISTGLALPTTLNYADSYDATHFSGALLVDATKVGYALGTMENGEIKMGIEPYATGYYNDVLQAHTRVGASSLYKVKSDIVKGVVSIIETV